MSGQLLNFLDVCDFKGGTQPPKSTFSLTPKEGYIRLLQIQDFSTDEYQVFVKESKKLSFCGEQDILIGRYGASVGKIFRGKSGAHNVALIRVLLDEKKVDRDYFFYFLQGEKFQSHLRLISARAAQAGFSKTGFSDFDFWAPKIENQRQIADRLTAQLAEVETARQAAKVQMRELTKLANSIIYDSSKKVAHAPRTLGDVLNEVKKGIGQDWKSYPVFGATRDGLAPAKEQPGKHAPKYKPVFPSTVFYNPMRILIGSIALVDEDDIPGITSPDYVALQGKEGVVDSRWFYYWLRSPLGEQCILSLARGAVRERMLFNRLAEGSIALPSFAEQKKLRQRLKNCAHCVAASRKNWLKLNCYLKKFSPKPSTHKEYNHDKQVDPTALRHL